MQVFLASLKRDGAGGAPTVRLPLPSPALGCCGGQWGNHSCVQLLVLAEPLPIIPASQKLPVEGLVSQWWGELELPAWLPERVLGASQFLGQINIQNLLLSLTGVCFGLLNSLF